MVLSSALVYSTSSPVSVWGTVFIHGVFSWKCLPSSISLLQTNFVFENPIKYNDFDTSSLYTRVSHRLNPFGFLFL